MPRAHSSRGGQQSWDPDQVAGGRGEDEDGHDPSFGHARFLELIDAYLARRRL
ncbi:MAG: hypothetical protein ACREER_01630 [Alphaproteobacteria bacterium]